MNRREFLQYTAVLALTTACGQFRSSDGAASKILVIGAGMAGLGAARLLHDAGQQVTVLEARERIGGRLWTSRLWEDAPLDMGASWIHGTSRNPLTDLANEIEASRAETDYENGYLYNTDGSEVSDALWEEIDALGNEVLSAAEDEADDSMSIMEAVEETAVWQNLSPAEQQQVAFVLNASVEHEFSGSLSELSGTNWDDSSAFGGEDVIFPDGYDRLAHHLARDLDIRLEQVVETVSYGYDGVTVTTNQTTLTADAVLVTVPLGVLKAGAINFAPPLPENKQAAIDTLGMGLLNKTYLRFDEAFWPKRPEWLHRIPEKYGRWTSWLNIYHYTKRPILLGFNAADFGREIEAWSDEAIVADAMDVLRTIYGPNTPDPIDWQITRWASDPFSYGSYSFNGIGASANERRALGRSVDGGLYFAGEATAVNYPSTVHGALISGRNAAEAILSDLG
ncbi:MAG: FAD-dependent oxidoreductase [Chloroflexota bacterium]